MSDTPETDSQITYFSSISKYGKRFTNRTGTVSAEFARGLERQRNEARAMAEQMSESNQVLMADVRFYREAWEQLKKAAK